MNTKEDTFVTYRRRKSRYTEEFEDIQLEDTNSDMGLVITNLVVASMR